MNLIYKEDVIQAIESYKSNCKRLGKKFTNHDFSVFFCKKYGFTHKKNLIKVERICRDYMGGKA